ncbi:MAG: hypothetical protein IJG87_09835 [Ruminococcus sp.]|nr:hypothetical protein [Ruminococcus sp.]
MLTALQIEEHQGGVLRFFRRNRIRVEHRYCDAAALKSVTYEHYRGKIGWTAIDRFVKAQRNRVLCPPQLELPADCGYKRFVSHDLDRRMCENAALFLLKEAEHRGCMVILIDKQGDSVGICEYLTEYCDPLYVITEAAEIYAAQSDYLLNERGAALRICRTTDRLKDADLIIAPDRLTERLPCSCDALILTAEKPAVRQICTVIHDYEIELPQKYRELCPAFLDEMYFASALYATSQARELGSEVFTRCGDGVVLHTRKSLLNTFKNRVDSP